jgi:3'-phosphoadenosine 5'-phosphosulfate sulfotransferase (PAPS reductase)/FAD synthetase
MKEKNRIISWFSCGANSAVATKMTIKKYGLDRVDIVNCDTGGEHPDNVRFLLDCEEWFGKKITVLKNDKYDDHFDVWEKTGWINGVMGARCTTELKKVLRFAYQRIDDIQVFGYSAEEEHRIERFTNTFPEVITEFPLKDSGLQKSDCVGLLMQVGIDIPVMYKLGFSNNNCIGCCKGGAGYWNRIRKYFPEEFRKASTIERKVGHAIVRVDNEPVFLDELDPKAGDQKEQIPSCDFLCQTKEDLIT